MSCLELSAKDVVPDFAGDTETHLVVLVCRRETKLGSVFRSAGNEYSRRQLTVVLEVVLLHLAEISRQLGVMQGVVHRAVDAVHGKCT